MSEVFVRFLKIFKNTGSVHRRPGSGRPWTAENVISLVIYVQPGRCVIDTPVKEYWNFSVISWSHSYHSEESNVPMYHRVVSNTTKVGGNIKNAKNLKKYEDRFTML